MQRIPVEPGRGLRQADPFLRLGLGERLNVGAAVIVGGVHHLQGVEAVEPKNAGQDVHDEIHRRHFVIMDDDAVQRRLGGLLIQAFVGVGEGLGR